MPKTAPKKNSSIYNNKILVLYELNNLLFRHKKDPWCLQDICKIMINSGKCFSCWIALTDIDGRIIETSLSGFEYYPFNPMTIIDGEEFAHFIKKTIFSSEIILNEDPLFNVFKKKLPGKMKGLMSKTFRLEFENKVYGILSVSNDEKTNDIENSNIIEKLVSNEIAHGLYRIEEEKRLREMEYKLRLSEENYRAIFETTGNATIIIEEDTVILLVNREFEKLSGYTREEIQGKKSWTEFIDKPDVDRMLAYHYLRRIDPQSVPRNYVFRFVDRTKNVKDIYMTISLIPGTKRSVASYMDITEQRSLEREILKISEEGRRQIGNDLHDGLGPHLVGIKFMINLLKQKLEKKGIEEISDVVEINDLITQAVNHTRRLVKGLCPVDLDDTGLILAIKDLAESTMQLFKINSTFEYDESIYIDDNMIATNLYYIALEAVNNAVKHAKAKNIEISLKHEASSLMLTIKDDGDGIPDNLDKKKGMGLNIMKYRARIINSLIDIRKNETGGTSIICAMRYPIEEKYRI